MSPQSAPKSVEFTNMPLADLHMVADGKRIEPLVDGLVARFFVHARVRTLALVSRTARPCDIFDSGDQRELGVCLAGLTIIDGLSPDEPIAIGDPRLVNGVHDVEDGYRRWTSGRVPLPPDILGAHPNGFFVRVELASLPFC